MILILNIQDDQGPCGDDVYFQIIYLFETIKIQNKLKDVNRNKQFND
jgi:hypothetical protein